MIYSGSILRVCSLLPPPSPAVCNEVPEEPVLSPASNNVFEKRLVVKYVEDNGTDPINGEPLSVDQLLEIKGLHVCSLE